VPDWQSLSSPNASFPTTCADGGGALAERAPSVTLVDPSFDVPRSWRASLNWGTNVRKWSLKVDALGSYDLSQPSTLDANFAGTPRFALAGEDNRSAGLPRSTPAPARCRRANADIERLRTVALRNDSRLRRTGHDDAGADGPLPPRCSSPYFVHCSR
jgi:hypothetical protein